MYWIQAFQRTDENQALEFAKQEAKTLGVPLVVVFIIVVDNPSANLRSFSFMLDGLRDAKNRLEDSGIRFVALKGNPTDILPSVSKHCARSSQTSGISNTRLPGEENSQVLRSALCSQLKPMLLSL